LNFEKNGKKIGHIQREFNMLPDVFSVEVFDEDEVLFLVAIDKHFCFKPNFCFSSFPKLLL